MTQGLFVIPEEVQIVGGVVPEDPSLAITIAHKKFTEAYNYKRLCCNWYLSERFSGRPPADSMGELLEDLIKSELLPFHFKQRFLYSVSQQCERLLKIDGMRDKMGQSKRRSPISLPEENPMLLVPMHDYSISDGALYISVPGLKSIRHIYHVNGVSDLMVLGFANLYLNVEKGKVRIIFNYGYEHKIFYGESQWKTKKNS